jgi:steroid delta-isomerase
MTTITRPRLVDDYAAAISSFDVDRYLANFADDAVVYEPVGTAGLTGKASLREFFANFTNAFISSQVEIPFAHAIGKEIAIKWNAHGVGKNGQTVDSEGIEIWKLNDDGKIQTLFAYWNPTALLEKVTP